MIQSILESGAGTSKENAFKVKAVSEEYDVLRVLRAELVKQSLDTPYDVMKVMIDSQESTLYFDVSRSLEAQSRKLEGAATGGSR